jgi:hypothetical protein
MAAGACILTVNGGSSSIKFALYVVGDLLRRILDGSLQRIGLPEATFVVKGSHFTFRGPWRYRTHPSAAGLLMGWLHQRIERGALTGVGHRGLSGRRTRFQHFCLAGCILRPDRRARRAWLRAELGTAACAFAPQSRGSCIFGLDVVTADLNGRRLS